MRDVESMRAIARAHQNRNLADFEKALRDYKEGVSFSINGNASYPLYIRKFRTLVGLYNPLASRRSV